MAFSQTDLEARPDRLIATARDLANETGSAAFTVAQVTERSELSLKAFYQCFRGKDELLLALLTQDSRIGAEVLAERIGNRRGEEAVHAYVIELFDMLSLPGAIGYAGCARARIPAPRRASSRRAAGRAAAVVRLARAQPHDP